MEDLFCIGCGAKLQTDDESKEGYVHPNALNKENILCKRCFQLQHYGIFNKDESLDNSLDFVTKTIKSEDALVLQIDAAFCYVPLINTLNGLKGYNNIVIVINRYDLYRNYINKNKLMHFAKSEIEKSALKIKKIFILDNNIDEIFDYLDNTFNNDIYLLGLENAGKTTFINKILAAIANEKKIFLTVSKYPGTTTNEIKIPLDDYRNLIDLPGIKSKGSILNFISKDYLKKLYPDTKINCISYQLESNQSLMISNIVVFNYLKGMKQGIVFYGSSQLEINRSKYENINRSFDNNIKYLKLKSNDINSFNELVNHNFTINDNQIYDIVIEGLGFFKVSKGMYSIKTIKGVNVFVRKSMFNYARKER